MKRVDNGVYVTNEELRDAIQNGTIMDLVYGIEANLLVIQVLNRLEEMDKEVSE